MILLNELNTVLNLIGMDFPTQTDKTKKFYLERASRLYQRASKELLSYEYETLSYSQFVYWFLSKKKTFRGSTYRQYKSSIIFFLQCYLENNEDAIVMDLLIVLKKDNELQDGIEQSKKVKKTSSLKMKFFIYNELLTLLNYLESIHEDDLRNWIIAGIATGLRPSEWETASLTYKSGRQCLIVQNGKYSNGRANGKERIIYIDKLNDVELKAIASHVKKSNQHGKCKQFTKFYNHNRLLLHSISKGLFTDRVEQYSLYTARHQFAANAKASNYSYAEIAALMGHISDVTSTIHYAKANKFFTKCSVSPDIENVRTVKQSTDKKFSWLKSHQKELSNSILVPKNEIKKR